MSHPTRVCTRDYDAVIKKLTDFCRNKGMLEAYVQGRRTILSACEDPETMSIYSHGGQTWPLPQTGQMNLELEMLRDRSTNGYFCISTSYRNEPEPIPGRHDLIFPMFEFEIHGDINNLIEFEVELLKYLGFSFDETKIERNSWKSMADEFEVSNDISGIIEKKIGDKYGSVFFLTDFPESTSPFWNMGRNGNIAKKIDVLLHGMETIGSAERETNVSLMRERFYTISDGKYAKRLFSEFGRVRVEDELNDYLDHDFPQRSGGGIGLTRLIRAMKLSNLL